MAMTPPVLTVALGFSCAFFANRPSPSANDTLSASACYPQAWERCAAIATVERQGA
jgi:hypothetical protein